MAIPFRLRRPDLVGTVMSTTRLLHSLRFQSVAADPWLSTAPSPARHDARAPPAVMGQRLPDGIDAPVHAMEPPIADPAGDPLVADAERKQLRPVDHSVVARGHAEKPLLDVEVGELFVHLDG